MLKHTLALLGLTLSSYTNAAIISVDSPFGADTITRDTSTQLDWLDVTETRGLSYTTVVSQMGTGGEYEGWRHATPEEFDQLITNFGYLPVNTSCRFEVIRYCDSNISGDSLIIEKIIDTLGDTYDAHFDSINGARDYFPGGGGAYGILNSSLEIDSWYDSALIYDGEYFSRTDPNITTDDNDSVSTYAGSVAPDTGHHLKGHFLVQTSQVPIPTSAWLFGSALVSLIQIKRRKQQNNNY